MSPQPTLTIAIPFRGRHEQVHGLLKSILKSTSQNLEIVLADNSENNSFPSEFVDPRVHYLRSTGNLTMSENWSFCLNASRGKYITVLGADESVLPFELDGFIRNLEETGEPFFYAPPIYFEWPYLKSPFGAVLARLRHFFPSQISDLSLGNLAQLHEKALIPNPYARGAARRELLLTNGEDLSIPCNAPDFFLSVTATLRLQGERLTTTPFFPFVVGTSAKSTGLRWGKEESAEWLNSEIGPGHGDLTGDFHKAYEEAVRKSTIDGLKKSDYDRPPQRSSDVPLIQNQRRALVAVIPIPPGVGNHGAAVLTQALIRLLRKIRLLQVPGRPHSK